MANRTTPAQPANPPKGTSPSKGIQRAADIAWDSWHQHGNKDAAGAIADQPKRNPSRQVAEKSNVASSRKLRLQDTTGVLTPRMVASQRNGAAGGRARAAKTTFEQRQAWGEQAGAATLARHGHAYFRHIVNLRWAKRRP